MEEPKEREEPLKTPKGRSHREARAEELEEPPWSHEEAGRARGARSFRKVTKDPRRSYKGAGESV